MQHGHPLIPRHEPETVAAAARQWHGDREKVATTSVRGVTFDSVDLSSRYDKGHEYDAMILMVEAVSPRLRSKIRSIFCDSKAQCCYSVELNPCSRREAVEIGRQLACGSKEQDGGHNGIFITGAAGSQTFLYPDWYAPFSDDQT